MSLPVEGITNVCMPVIYGCHIFSDVLGQCGGANVLCMLRGDVAVVNGKLGSKGRERENGFMMFG